MAPIAVKSRGKTRSKGIWQIIGGSHTVSMTVTPRTAVGKFVDNSRYLPKALGVLPTLLSGEHPPGSRGNTHRNTGYCTLRLITTH